jgi:beta-phosphoglucomutase family hydrolase
MTPAPQAFIFDLNGTMIDDMEYHNRAWSRILNDELGAGLSQEAVAKEMYGKNEELLIRIFGPDRFTKDEIQRLSTEKEKTYQEAFLPELRLITGLDVFLEQAQKAGVKIAIGSAAIPSNIDFVIDNLSIRHYFSAIVSADDVTTSKPNPETFIKAAAQLGIAPENCIVFEDAPKGVEAAANAGMQAVVLTTMHGAEAFTDYKNIMAYISNYNDPQLQTLLT